MAVVEVCRTDGTREAVRVASYPDGAFVGRIACTECGGSGWWDFAPYAVPGAPCVDCKGTGRLWVGLA